MGRIPDTGDDHRSTPQASDAGLNPIRGRIKIGRTMTRRNQLFLIVGGAVFVASAISHAAVRLFKLERSPRLVERIGVESQNTPLCAAGSSLLFYGLDWELISKALGRGIIKCGVPAASPSELEQVASPIQTDATVIGISLYDLNEHLLSDFRSEVVPFGGTVRDLYASNADWPFTKRLVGQYPLTYARTLFPTAGRSLGVMVGIRRELRQLLGRGAGTSGAEPALTFEQRGSAVETIESWTEGRTLRNLAQIETGCQGRWEFNGPKRLALQRLVGRAQEKGHVFLVVMPQPPPFLKKFATAEVLQRFERALAEIGKAHPQVVWVRLDRAPVLQSSRCYWDLVHLNGTGQQLATPMVLEAVKGVTGPQ